MPIDCSAVRVERLEFMLGELRWRLGRYEEVIKAARKAINSPASMRRWEELENTVRALDSEEE